MVRFRTVLVPWIASLQSIPPLTGPNPTPTNPSLLSPLRPPLTGKRSPPTLRCAGRLDRGHSGSYCVVLLLSGDQLYWNTLLLPFPARNCDRHHPPGEL